jgi:hypothetical protein
MTNPMAGVSGGSNPRRDNAKAASAWGYRVFGVLRHLMLVFLILGIGVIL